MRAIVALLSAAFVFAPTMPIGAQGETLGALEGTIHERSTFRSVKAARIAVRRVESDSGISASAVPDANGRYRLDSLPPGRYQARVVSASLDSLRVAPPTTDLRITPGRVVLADFTLPSGTAVRDALCADRLGERRGVVAGRAIDADADGRPLVGAELVAVWMDFPVNRLTGRSVPTRRVVVVKSGMEGEYRVCGVPTETLFTLQLRRDGRASPVVRLLIGDGEGSLARDLSLSASTAPTIAALDSAARLATAKGPGAGRHELQTVGTAELTGTVRVLSGEPFVGAQVNVRHALSATVTDSAGRFVLRDLPAGTQMLEVRHPGYALAELPVELRSGKRTERAVLLVRPLTLDALPPSEAVVDLEAFESSRRTNRYGQFLTQEQIDAKKHVTETIDLFDDLLGFTPLGHGPDARIVSNVALASKAACFGANVIIEGAEGRRINDVKPGQIGGIEAYADASFVPGRFAGRAECGVVVIWLRKHQGPAARPATGLRANGYP